MNCAVAEKEKIKLNIGAAKTYIPGFINIDISDRADISLDLSKERLPFESDSVDLVFSYHTLEHIPDYLFALSEIHRVLKHGGSFLVGLPYATLSEYHLVNPYHLHNFNEFSFCFFDTKRLKGSAAEDNHILFNKIFHQFHYMGFFKYLPPFLQSWCRRHLLNVVKKIDYGLVAVKSPDRPLKEYSKKAMVKQFKEYLDSQIPYNQDSLTKNKEILVEERN